MKKINKDDKNELIIEVTSRFEKWVGYGALLFLGFPIVQFFLGKRLNEERLMGFIGGAVVCGLVYLVAYEEALFTFDSRTRLLKWRRKRSLSTKQGTLPFSRINQVVLQSAIGNKKHSPKHRVALLTGEGELPVSIAYEHHEMNQKIAERIRSRLGLSPEELVMDSVKALVEQGHPVGAVQLLQEKQGLSLTEAKAVVTRMKEQKNRS